MLSTKMSKGMTIKLQAGLADVECLPVEQGMAGYAQCEAQARHSLLHLQHTLLREAHFVGSSFTSRRASGPLSDLDDVE